MGSHTLYPDLIQARGFDPISVSDALPACFQGVFGFRYFNSIQTACFHALYNTRNSCMVSSPTGSGKTSLFELAILGMLRDFLLIRDDGLETLIPPRGQSKAVYVAPTRSLVQEKCKEWQDRFGSSLNLMVREFTGDSLENGKEVLQDTDILCVTPERFDSITRRNRHGGMGFFSQVKLVLLDEVHLLSDSRGPCLEAGVVSRLKMAQCNMLKENPDLGRHVHFRFLACSATFENIEDVASWLEIQPDSVFKFGNEMRPVPLDIIVKGYQSSKNAFLFNKKLDNHVISILREFADGKPALCFCSARDDVTRLANKLSTEYCSNDGGSIFLRDSQHARTLLEASKQIQNGTLKKCIQAGVGFHNAALSIGDRGIVEDLFTNKMLPVVATTSTLAMGVNLPAYLVIIRGIHVYRQGSGYVPLDYSTILQMIGRAGRPQFDRKGVAVIMAESKDRKSLENITSLSETIESCLKGSISEYLNAEICNRTVTDIVSALEWLKTTYLYTRVLKNPQHYGIPTDIGSDMIKLDAWLTEKLLFANVSLLVKGGMASTDEDGYDLQPTSSGILMAENYIRLATMSSICKAGPKSSIEDLIWILSNSEELTSSIVVRRDEKNSFLNPLNQSASVQYSIKESNAPGKRLARVKSANQKVFLLFMYALSSKCQQELKNVNFYLKQEANGVVSKAVQIVQCMVKQFSTVPEMAQALSSALLLRKILVQKRWADDPMLLTQAKDIGEVIASRLVKTGISNFRELLAADPRTLENLAQKHFPWGTKMKENVSKICPPPLQIQTKIESNENGSLQVQIRISMEEDTQQTASNGRGCSLLIYDLKHNSLISFRKLRYDAFAHEGLCINVAQTFQSDENNSIIVKVVDDSILGHDAHAATRVVPSESKSSNSDERKPIRGSPSPVESNLVSMWTQKPKGDVVKSTQMPPDAVILSTKKPSKRNSSGIAGRDDADAFRKKYKNLMDFLQIQ